MSVATLARNGLALAVISVLGTAPASAWWGHDRDDDDGDEGELEFDEARIFLELNATDEDLGIQALIDGEAWTSLSIEDPHGRRIMTVFNTGRLRQQGLTEIFFESDEPEFDELPPEVFFRRFPEGEYEIEARTTEGDELESEVILSHVLAAAPEGVTANGLLVPEDPDVCEEGGAGIPTVSAPITIGWEEVTESYVFDDEDAVPVEVVQYNVFFEPPEGGLTASLQVPGDVTSVMVPGETLALGEEVLKFEIQVRESNGNLTDFESCFRVAL